MLTAPELAVRQAGPSDAELLADLHHACFARAWGSIAMLAFALSPEMLCLIGSAGMPGGLLIARNAGAEAEILTFGVVPSCRNKGLGRVLLRTATERLRACGTKRLFLEVEEGNEAALRLYRSFGGEPVGRRHGYYDHGADAVIFSLAL